MATTTIGIQVTGIKGLSRALKTMGDTDAPFIREGLTESGPIFAGNARSEAPRHVASSVSFVGIRGTGATQKALITATAPDAARQEFGRAPKPYKKSGKGRRAVYGIKKQGYVYKGSKARPYFGVKRADHAVARSAPEIRSKLEAAIAKTWASLSAGGD